MIAAARLFGFLLLRLLPILVLGSMSARAFAQADPPGRVARLNYAEGAVVYAPAGDNEWTDVQFNRPLTRGDRLWTDKASRAEMQVGSSAVRLGGLTRVDIALIDDQATQLNVTQGSVYLRIRSLPEGENFEIDTPNLAWRAAYPGDFRIDVDAAHDTTRVTIHSGTGAVYGEGGQVLPLGGGQQITFRGRTLAQVNAQESPPQDAFDRWAADRNRREDQSVSARHVPREVVGYQQLDAHGQWANDATFGAVWFPQGTPANWAPYRVGHWESIAPWGWTWIDDAAWGFAPFHYGRWALVNSRWAWVPGRIGLKPVYAPALVAFIGGSSGGVNWNIAMGGGKPGVAWFPLAPGEAWQPGYRASPVYMSNLNRDLATQPNPTYAHQRRPEALTAISTEDFHRGRPSRGNWLRVAANTLNNVQVVPPPPVPDHTSIIDREKVAGAAPAAVAKAASAPVANAASAAIATAAPAAVASAASQAQARAKAAEAARQARLTHARALEAAKAEAAKQEAAKVAQARAAEAARSAQAQAALRASQVEAQAQSSAQAQKVAEAQRAQRIAEEKAAARNLLARRAEQARQERLAKRQEASQRELQAKHESQQARREQSAKRALQARREQEAKARQDQLARRKALALHEEEQRRAAHAQQVEHARRAADRDAQVLREQRTQREEQARREEQVQRDNQAGREAQEREQAQREAAAQRQQQALIEQMRRDQQEQQRARSRQRPDLRDDTRSRGIPIIGSPMS
jgi:hypothetical protein